MAPQAKKKARRRRKGLGGVGSPHLGRIPETVRTALIKKCLLSSNASLPRKLQTKKG